MDNNRATLVLPSKGALAEPTTNFLKDCGLRVHKPNPRQYIGSMPQIPAIDVMFQRVKDVVYKVADGTAQLGVTGLDVVHENPNDDLIVIQPDLEYGQCKLLVAVPEAWVDVETMTDLAEVALDIRERQGRNMRIATTYTTSARKFLHECGIHHFTLVKAEGAIEAAPTLGHADAVVDLTQTGTTLRENRLKPLDDGIIVESQACLIGNRRALQANPATLETLRLLLEHMDAALYGKRYYQLTANVRGTDAESVAEAVAANPITRGLQGPTVANIYSGNGDGQWYTVTIIIHAKNLLAAVEHLRAIGGTQTVAVPARFVFLENSPTFERLRQAL